MDFILSFYRFHIIINYIVMKLGWREASNLPVKGLPVRIINSLLYHCEWLCLINDSDCEGVKGLENREYYTRLEPAGPTEPKKNKIPTLSVLVQLNRTDCPIRNSVSTVQTCLNYRPKIFFGRSGRFGSKCTAASIS